VGGELGQQPGLADAGLAHDLHRARSSCAQAIKLAVELGQLRPAPYEVIGEIEDEGLVATIRAGRDRQTPCRSGSRPDVRRGPRHHARAMPRYLLAHRHGARECAVVFAAFKGYDSPLRHAPAIATCVSGGHGIWWIVDAAHAEGALALLPFYVATRTTAIAVTEVLIP
jgi:hypothetical protein